MFGEKNKKDEHYNSNQYHHKMNDKTKSHFMRQVHSHGRTRMLFHQIEI